MEQELQVLEFSFGEDEWDDMIMIVEDGSTDGHATGSASQHLGITSMQLQHLLDHQQAILPTLPLHRMASSSKEKTEVSAEGIKDMVKQAVQEALSNHKEKKHNKQNVITYDTTRRQGMDPRDPRAQEIQWPCFGQHSEKKHGNRFGHWMECTKCGLRMWYEPEISAPGEATKSSLPMNVTEALERLRINGWARDTITAKDVRAMIGIVSREKALIKPKGKSKAYPGGLPPDQPTIGTMFKRQKEAQQSASNPESIPIHSDSEEDKAKVDFEIVETQGSRGQPSNRQ